MGKEFNGALDRHFDRMLEEQQREEEAYNKLREEDEKRSVTVEPSPCRACDCAMDNCMVCFEVDDETD